MWFARGFVCGERNGGLEAGWAVPTLQWLVSLKRARDESRHHYSTRFMPLHTVEARHKYNHQSAENFFEALIESCSAWSERVTGLYAPSDFARFCLISN